MCSLFACASYEKEQPDYEAAQLMPKPAAMKVVREFMPDVVRDQGLLMSAFGTSCESSNALIEWSGISRVAFGREGTSLWANKSSMCSYVVTSHPGIYKMIEGWPRKFVVLRPSAEQREFLKNALVALGATDAVFMVEQ